MAEIIKEMLYVELHVLHKMCCIRKVLPWK